MAKSKVSVFYRIVKAESGHQFANLYAVEKIYFNGDSFLKREIVHEWDNRIISEAILSRLGGGDAYESFKLEHEVATLEASLEKGTKPVEARTEVDFKDLTKKQLKNELKCEDM